jgi:hypothetical protein
MLDNDTILARLHSFFLAKDPSHISICEIKHTAGFLEITLKKECETKSFVIPKDEFYYIVRAYRGSELYQNKLIFEDQRYVNLLQISTSGLLSIGVYITDNIHKGFHSVCSRVTPYSYREVVFILENLNHLSIYEKILLALGLLNNENKNLIRCFNNRDWIVDYRIDWLALRETWNLFLSKRFRLSVEAQTQILVAHIVIYIDPSFNNADLTLATHFVYCANESKHSKDELRILYPMLKF